MIDLARQTYTLPTLHVLWWGHLKSALSHSLDITVSWSLRAQQQVSYPSGELKCWRPYPSLWQPPFHPMLPQASLLYTCTLKWGPMVFLCAAYSMEYSVLRIHTGDGLFTEGFPSSLRLSSICVCICVSWFLYPLICWLALNSVFWLGNITLQ